METGEYMHVKLGELHPNPYQPPTRLTLTEEAARRGGESILRSGLIQIPLCRAVPKGGGVVEFQVGDGWQRHEWFAWLVRNGHPEYGELPVTLRELSDQQMADLIEETDENKSNLNIMERAWLWRKYLADFKNVTQAQLAERRHVSQGEIANTIRLLELPDEVQDMIITQEITPTHGRSLLQLKEKALMLEYAGTAYKNGWTVATLDEVIKVFLDKQKPKMGIAENWREGSICSTCVNACPDIKCRPEGSAQTAEGKVQSCPSHRYKNEPTGAADKVRICRVCKRTNVAPCLGGENWTEEDLCNICFKKGAEDGEAADSAGDNREEAGQPGTDESDGGDGDEGGADDSKASGTGSTADTGAKPGGQKKGAAGKQEKQKPVTKPAPQKTPSTPVRSTAPATVKTNWGRKLVIEEKKDHVLVSVMKAGGVPAFKKLETGLTESLTFTIDWLQELEEQWAKEGK